MIDPRELRIGNHLRRKSNGNYCIVTARMIVEIEDGLAGDYEPVLLTEDILLSCGFESVEGDGEKYNPDDEYKNSFEYRLDVGIFYRDLICKPALGWYVFIQDSDMIGEKSLKSKNIYFLHELQNLYFAITGKELEVKL